MGKQIGYMFLDNQLTVVLNGRPFDIDPGHPKFKEIRALLTPAAGETPEMEAARCEAIATLINMDRLDLRETAAFIGFEDVRVEHGVVFVKDKPLHNSLTRRILELKKAGLPYDAFIRFLAELSKNPSEESRMALFDFLEQGKFPLTDDGCFLGYKGVMKGTLHRQDGTEYQTLVDCHSGSFDMAPGNKHSMPWDAVDDNRNEACGAGFHVGTISHARGFGGVMIVVKVNPKDCVSVPKHDTTKLRCCAYEVVNIFEDNSQARELIKPVYSDEAIRDDEFETHEDEEYALREPTEEDKRNEWEEMGRDDICREAARRGLFASTNEARWLGKELVIQAIMSDSLPVEQMNGDQLAELAVRRHLYASVNSAKKSGRDKMISELTEDTVKRQQEMKGQA